MRSARTVEPGHVGLALVQLGVAQLHAVVAGVELALAGVERVLAPVEPALAPLDVALGAGEPRLALAQVGGDALDLDRGPRLGLGDRLARPGPASRSASPCRRSAAIRAADTSRSSSSTRWRRRSSSSMRASMPSSRFSISASSARRSSMWVRSAFSRSRSAAATWVGLLGQARCSSRSASSASRVSRSPARAASASSRAGQILLRGRHGRGCLLHFDQFGVHRGEGLLALGQGGETLLDLGGAPLGVGVDRGDALLRLLHHGGALLDGRGRLAHRCLLGRELVQRPGQVGLLGGDRLQAGGGLVRRRRSLRFALGNGRESRLDAFLAGLQLLGALHHVRAHRVDGELLLGQHLLNLLGTVLAVGQLGLAAVQARLELGQLRGADCPALAQLLDEPVALPLDTLARSPLLLQALLDGGELLLDLGDPRRHGRVDVDLVRCGIPLGRLDLARGDRLLAGVELGGAPGEIGLHLLEMRALGLAAGRRVRRCDALADRQGGLALGELALAPGQPAPRARRTRPSPAPAAPTARAAAAPRPGGATSADPPSRAGGRWGCLRYRASGRRSSGTYLFASGVIGPTAWIGLRQGARRAASCPGAVSAAPVPGLSVHAGQRTSSRKTGDAVTGDRGSSTRSAPGRRWRTTVLQGRGENLSA